MKSIVVQKITVLSQGQKYMAKSAYARLRKQIDQDPEVLKSQDFLEKLERARERAQWVLS
jgi:hypothetical protein